MRKWWWFSFADPDRPKGKQWLGAAIVQGATIEEALTNSHLLGCNPGGTIQAKEIGPVPPPKEWLNRLLDREEVRRCPPPMVQ